MEPQEASASGVDKGLMEMKVVFSDLSFTVTVKEKGEKALKERHILSRLSGCIQPRRLTAIMGASGAGKTTMLNVLAGHTTGGAEAQLSGTISVNGEAMAGSRMRTISAYVHQEDVLLDTMTVREALLFNTHLKLPKEMSVAAKEKRALDIATLMALTKSLDNRIGSATSKGISGGEKRRLSLACELVTNPAILFCDEPTSGLDSFTAYRVARILQHLAHKHHRTIGCTIHQPSSEVFALFDDLLVLAEGQVVYQGPVPEMLPYLTKLGYQCPANFNVPDFLFLEVLNPGGSAMASDTKYDFIKGRGTTAEAKAQAHEQEVQRIQGLIKAWENSQENQQVTRSLTLGPGAGGESGVHEDALRTHAGVGTQFWLLLVRACRHSVRHPLILRGKLAQTLFLSIIAGLIFLQLDPDLEGAQSRLGALFFLTVQALMGTTTGVLNVFGGEKPVFKREYDAHMYSVPVYFFSRILVELPAVIIMPVLSSVITFYMIGFDKDGANFGIYFSVLMLMDLCGVALGLFVSCVFSSIEVALAVLPAFLMPLIVFSGFFVNSDTLGWWFRWITYISPIQYGFMALAKNEFEGLTIYCQPSQPGCSANGTRSGQQVLETAGFSSRGSAAENIGILFALSSALIIMAYVALSLNVRKAAR